MSIEKVVEAVEQILLPKQLNSVEQFVLCQSWLGKTYNEMAESFGYGSDYIKEVGSRLWQELSEALGQRVTKKNLYLVLQQYQPSLRSVTSEIVTSDRDNYSLSVTNTNSQKLVTDKCLLPTVTYSSELEFPSDPLPLGSSLYINRPPIEELAYREISRLGCVIRIKASMKMGKSSLLNRIIARAIAQEKYKTIYIDFQEADEDIFTSLDKFLRWFCANMARQLHLKPNLDDYWDRDMGSKVSCKIYLEGYLLEQIDCPLVLALNEVNRVFEYSHIAQDFLPMLRSWHEQAQQLQVWQQLRLVIVHTTDIYVPLKLNQSPFNVGLSLRLPPFNLEQVRELAQRYGLDWQDEVGTRYVMSLLAMVGGHPYLVNLALYHVRQGGMTLEELLQTAPTTGGIYSHYLRSHLAVLREQPQLASILRQVVMANQQVSLDAIAAHKLESMGLIQLDGNWAKPSCELYKLYFREQLRTEYWSDLYPEQLQLEQQAQRCLSSFDEPTHVTGRSYFDRYLLSKIDERTHLANRNYFNQYLEATWQQLLVEAASLSLIIGEIDNFKPFTAACELSAADICLQLIGSTILDCLDKQVACAARYDKRAFAVILPYTDPETAAAITENIQVSVRALAAVEANGSQVREFPTEAIAVSLGVASITPSAETSAAMLVAAAEDALKQAKRCGCHCVTIG